MDNIKSYINSGADINIANELGITPLMVSAKSGNIEIVKILVLNGARLNTKDNKDFTALYYATASNNINIVKYLVQNGAQISDNIYMTAMYKNYKDICLYFDSLDSVKQIIKEK